MANCDSCGSSNITININPQPTGFSSYNLSNTSYSCNSCGCSSTYSTGSCTECSEECSDMTNTSCAVYNGEDLDNLDVITNDSLNVVLTAIDTVVGDIKGNSSTLYSSKSTITAASVLTLYTIPIKLLDAPGAGKYINILSIDTKVSGGSVPYGVNPEVEVYQNGSSNSEFSSTTSLSYTDGRLNRLLQVGDDSNVLENVDIYISGTTGNPSGGDGDLNVYITYQIINL